MITDISSLPGSVVLLHFLSFFNKFVFAVLKHKLFYVSSEPMTYVENADVIHGLRNSLDNSFTDPSLISLREDLFDSRNNSNSKLPSLTLPKEVRFGIVPLEVCIC